MKDTKQRIKLRNGTIIEERTVHDFFSNTVRDIRQDWRVVNDPTGQFRDDEVIVLVPDIDGTLRGGAHGIGYDQVEEKG